MRDELGVRAMQAKSVAQRGETPVLVGDHVSELCHKMVCEPANSLSQLHRDRCDDSKKKHKISQLQQGLKFDRCSFSTVQSRWVFL